MAMKLLCLCLSLVLLGPSGAEEQTCLKSASSCDECIESGPECAWCTAPDSNIRCDTSTGLESAGCLADHVYNPQGGVLIAKNDSSTEPLDVGGLFLQPQAVALRLRPGVSQSFPLTITRPAGELSSEMTMEVTMDVKKMPPGFNVTMKNIEEGNPLVVMVTVEFDRCPKNRTGPWPMHISPKGFSQFVLLEITLDCECECSTNREENSAECSGHGALVCGKCECHQSYTGRQCQRNTDSFFSQNEDMCRSGPNAPVCSGKGTCEEGFCECYKRENPKEYYAGRFCECSNFHCPLHNNRICGGHGKCMCGHCVCDNDWTGEACSCSLETASCTTGDQVLCNGRGICECGVCRCDSRYTGPTCERCPSCLGTRRLGHERGKRGVTKSVAA